VLNAPYRVKSAAMLHDGSQLKTQKSREGIVITVPAQAPDAIASVIKMELNERLPVEKIVSNTAKYFEITDEK
jgi:alpha-L-fucosidase